MNNVKTRNQSTYLYQDSDPVEDQIIWVKSESRNWVNNKITKLQDKKKVSETEESETMIMKNEKESSSKCTRHFNIRLFYETDMIGYCNITIECCPTNKMIANYMSKLLVT